MPIMVKGNNSVLFIHIPKCGGSSFERIMSDRGWTELLSIRGVNANHLSFMRCSPQHMHAEHLNLMVRPEQFDSITALVRDPLSRLKSEYAWQMKQSMTTLPPEQWIEHVFEAYSNNPFVYDNHIRPQHHFLMDGVKVHKLEEDGINQALQEISPMPPKHRFFKLDFFNKKAKHLKKTIKSHEIHESFQNKSKMIQEFYVKDYEILGYALA